MTVTNAIEAKNLCKVYRVYPSPISRVTEFLTLGRAQRHKEVHALSNVSFEVPKGSMLGVIGSNGAGKSTLLRLLAGTARATSGSLQMNGHVASLLELGAGFFEGFTGRQNIRLSMSILGRSAAEIDARTEELIAFSELGDAIERPLRTYSSGMVLRLGFAIAATMQAPEILILDEVLAVGDDHFQRKSQKCIEELRASGTTIVLCAHAINEIRKLSHQVLWIDHGRVMASGDPSEVTDAYTDFERRRSDDVRDVQKGRFGVATGDKEPKILSLSIHPPEGKSADELRLGDALRIELEYQVPKALSGLHVGVAINTESNTIAFGAGTHFDTWVQVPREAGGRYRVQFKIDSLPLNQGRYFVTGFVFDENGMHFYDHAVCRTHIEVIPETKAPGLYVPPNQTWSFTPLTK